MNEIFRRARCCTCNKIYQTQKMSSAYRDGARFGFCRTCRYQALKVYLPNALRLRRVPIAVATVFTVILALADTNLPPVPPALPIPVPVAVAAPRYFKTFTLETNLMGDKGSSGTFDSRPCPVFPHTNTYIKTFQVISNTVVWQVLDGATNEFKTVRKKLRSFQQVTIEVIVTVTNRTTSKIDE